VLAATATAFTSPSHALFIDLACAWVCATGRRTICGMVAVMDPTSRGAHDAYHRLVRAGAWSLDALWGVIVTLAVAHVGPGPIVVVLDDTLLHRPGRKVDGAGSWRDAVRSTANRVVHARGLNLVVLAVRINPPWGGMPIAVPVGVSLHRKGGDTLGRLAAALVRRLAERLPERDFVLCADGAYATLAGQSLPRTTVVSRLRRDAALYGPRPPRTGRRGRPRLRGERLPTPPELAAGVVARDWSKVTVEWRGRTETRLVWSKEVLWFRVCRQALVRLVVMRDPKGLEPDDYFFTTDLAMAVPDVISVYAGRWAIEVCHRDVKQLVGGEQPQSWKHRGPERAAALAFWMHAAVWLAYLAASGDQPAMIHRDWYPQKTTPSFADAMAEVRRALWRQRICPDSEPAALTQEMTTVLVEALAAAA